MKFENCTVCITEPYVVNDGGCFFFLSLQFDRPLNLVKGSAVWTDYTSELTVFPRDLCDRKVDALDRTIVICNDSCGLRMGF